VTRRPAGGWRESRGAVAVEAVLVLPLVIVLLLGVTDLGFLLRDYVAATAYARVGARTASALPRMGMTAADPTSFAGQAADAMARSSTSLDPNDIDAVWVYLAGPDGHPQGSDSFDSASCHPSICIAYRWVDGSPGAFEWVSGTWDPASINACLADPAAQSVGVFVQVTHPWVAGFFPGGSTTIRAHTVMKFEPLMPTSPPLVPPPAYRTAGCKP
jgi:hypothetical protein